MPKNPRISVKERNLIKGALRRVFSRSDLRKEVIERSRIKHVDDSRKRVTKWSRCPICEAPTPTYLMEVDHRLPVVPLDTSLEEMAFDVLVDNIWCALDNLLAICKTCHKAKTKAENQARRAYKKGKKNGTSK